MNLGRLPNMSIRSKPRPKPAWGTLPYFRINSWQAGGLRSGELAFDDRDEEKDGDYDFGGGGQKVNSRPLSGRCR